MKIFNIFASIVAFATAATCAKVDIANWDYTDITVGDTYTIELVTEAKSTQVGCRADAVLRSPLDLTKYFPPEDDPISVDPEM